LPALVAAALLRFYPLVRAPTGFAATLIVTGLIARRAGVWWRRAPAPSLVAAASAKKSFYFHCEAACQSA
jgi:hypothetical protein